MDLIFYDDNGKLIFSLGGQDKVIEVSSVLVEVPEDKILVSIDPTSKEPIFEDRPLSVEERLTQLEASQSDQDEAIDALAESLGGE